MSPVGQDLELRGSFDVARGGQSQLSDFTLMNARIFFRNFAGRESQFNAAGKRNFGLAIHPEDAKILRDQGWNVKQLRAREEGDQPQDWLPVEVSYRNKPPRVVMVTEKFNRATGNIEAVRTTIPEEQVEMVDFAETTNIDVKINPYPYDFNGNKGVKAYLKAMYITIRMDELEKKYASIPEVDFEGNMLDVLDLGFEEGIIDGEIIEDIDINDM